MAHRSGYGTGRVRSQDFFQEGAVEKLHKVWAFLVRELWGASVNKASDPDEFFTESRAHHLLLRWYRN